MFYSSSVLYKILFYFLLKSYHFLAFVHHSSNKLVVNAVLNEKTTSGDAIFSLVEEHAAHALAKEGK